MLAELDHNQVAFSKQFSIKCKHHCKCIPRWHGVDGCKCLSETPGLFSGAAALLSDAQHKGMYRLLCKRTHA
jgi:hypothetical protein